MGLNETYFSSRSPLDKLPGVPFAVAPGDATSFSSFVHVMIRTDRPGTLGGLVLVAVPRSWRSLCWDGGVGRPWHYSWRSS